MRGLVAALCMWASVASAQPREFSDFHTWADATVHVWPTKQVRIDATAGLRGVISDDDWTVVLVRPAVAWFVRPWLIITSGLMANLEFTSEDDSLEVRPQAGIFLGARGPLDIEFSSFARAEYRAFYYFGERRWDGVGRVRWRLQAKSPKLETEHIGALYGVASIEPFIELGEAVPGSLVESVRYLGGVGSEVTSSSRLELNYLWHRVRFPDEDGDLELDDHVVRVRWFYTVQ